jgi:hypothetical protein
MALQPRSGLGLPYGFRDGSVYYDVGHQLHDQPGSSHPDSATRDI